MSARRASVSISIAIVLAIVGTASLVGVVGCTGREQALGGHAPSEATTVPTSWNTDSNTKCPWRRPVEGSECATVDDKGAPAAPQCTYDRDTTQPSICVCGFGGRWSCFHAASGILTTDSCYEGERCGDGAGCSTDQQTCTCAADQTLRCLARTNP